MNCIQLHHLAGFDCTPCRSLLGEDALDVRTKFTWIDGEPIGFYIIDQGSTLLISDNGDTLSHLRNIGLNLTSKRKWGAVQNIAKQRGLSFSDGGELLSCSGKASAEQQVSSFIATLMSIADYERLHVGISEKVLHLADEVEEYLRVWKPHAELQRKVTLQGQSSREYVYDFLLDDMVIGVVQPNAAAVGGLMRKAGDTLGGPDMSGRRLLAIVDDRIDPDSARDEINIISSLMSAMPLSRLIQHSKAQPAVLH